MNKRKLFPHILLLALLMTLPAAVAQEANGARELASRLLGNWGGQSEMEIQFEPGSLPSALEGELPVPDELQLVGSFTNVNTSSGEIQNGTIVFDAAASTGEVLQAVTASYAEAGWEQQMQAQNVGFLPANPDVHATFCAPDDALTIYFNAFARGDETSDVRYELVQGGGYDACAEAAWMERPVLPQIPAPGGSELRIHSVN